MSPALCTRKIVRISKYATATTISFAISFSTEHGTPSCGGPTRDALSSLQSAHGGGSRLTPEPKRGLILGHGGGSLAKWLALVWPELELDVVEFDPAVVRMAEQYFEYRPPANHHVFVKDARVFLRDTE